MCAVPNGDYEVTVVVGDAALTSNRNVALMVENRNVINGVVSPLSPWIERTGMKDVLSIQHMHTSTHITHTHTISIHTYTHKHTLKHVLALKRMRGPFDGALVVENRK